MNFSRAYFVKRTLNKLAPCCIAGVLIISFSLLVLKHIGYTYPTMEEDLYSCTKTLLFIGCLYFIKTYKRDLFQ